MSCYKSQKPVYFQIPLYLYATRTPKMEAGQQLNGWGFWEGNEDTEMMGLEDTTVDELESEFDRLQVRPASNPTMRTNVLGSSLAKLKLLQRNFTRCTRLSRYEKGLLRNPQGRNQQFMIGPNIKSGAWDLADILRGYNIF